MIFDVLLVRERGYALPRWRSGMHSAIRADLRIADEPDAAWHRSTRVARLYDPATHTPLAHPPLYDVTLICVASEYLILSGIERIRDDLLDREIAYAQSWMLTLPPLSR